MIRKKKKGIVVCSSLQEIVPGEVTPLLARYTDRNSHTSTGPTAPRYWTMARKNLDHYQLATKYLLEKLLAKYDAT